MILKGLAMDAVFLSRIQFAVTTMFHILFPVLTIGLALYLVVVESLWLITKQEIYYRMYRFWVKIFAINFGIGVVSGVVLEFEFGTNFSRFSQRVGNIFSPLLAFEVMTAFFLEAGFLGIMLFGWERVRRSIHFLATCLVSFGSILSAFWILAANSWMQTPAGYELVDGKFMVADFSAAIFNPSLFARMGHMTLASFETSAFVVAGSVPISCSKGSTYPFPAISGNCPHHGCFVCASPGLLRDERAQGLPPSTCQNGCHRGPLGDQYGGGLLCGHRFPDMENERNLFELSIPISSAFSSPNL
jgi:cytochrome d ubiquinol oxidase subunit I